MIGLMLAAFAMQAAPDPCHAVGQVARPPACPQWRPVYRAEGRQVFIDPGALRRNGDTFELPLRAVLAEPVDGGWSYVALYRFDCRRRTVAAIYATFYNARGAITNRGPLGGPDMQAEVEPNSPNGRLLAEFCPR